MKLTKILTLVAVCLVFPIAGALHAGDSKSFLASYEKVRAALAADNLADAKKASAELGEPGAAIAKSETLDSARLGFAQLSDEAIKAASGQPGYYVMHCPMLKKDWVQTSKQVSNPYGGKDMVTCGEIKG
ncbi:MAG: hypothetical protein DLM52_01340 [Chthoniobacterales bacterium]|nr:MAG: hypothetical protein DLM52_01340 [Chthoniobacterales bacterium]